MGLNAEQAQAVACVSGPVVILAGAGSGKTTTVTRRIAHQVAGGTHRPERILAVTFTDKAAREMGSRLAALGFPGVRVKTFHAEALAQYRTLSGRSDEILPSKTPILVPLTQRLPMPHRFVSVRDIAAEIEWARNRRIGPEAYREAIGERIPPVPPDLMAGLYGSYERRKRERGLMDFEDLLDRTLDLIEGSDGAAASIRDRYEAFSVDEYQDVNLLQQGLLDAWVGRRRDLCVVGDDYQSIFGFTGAALHLGALPLRMQGRQRAVAGDARLVDGGEEAAVGLDRHRLRVGLAHAGHQRAVGHGHGLARLAGDGAGERVLDVLAAAGGDLLALDGAGIEPGQAVVGLVARRRHPLGGDGGPVPDQRPLRAAGAAACS